MFERIPLLNLFLRHFGPEIKCKTSAFFGENSPNKKIVHTFTQWNESQIYHFYFSPPFQKLGCSIIGESTISIPKSPCHNSKPPNQARIWIQPLWQRNATLKGNTRAEFPSWINAEDSKVLKVWAGWNSDVKRSCCKSHLVIENCLFHLSDANLNPKKMRAASQSQQKPLKRWVPWPPSDSDQGQHAKQSSKTEQTNEQ